MLLRSCKNLLACTYPELQFDPGEELIATCSQQKCFWRSCRGNILTRRNYKDSDI